MLSSLLYIPVCNKSSRLTGCSPIFDEWVPLQHILKPALIERATSISTEIPIVNDNVSPLMIASQHNYSPAFSQWKIVGRQILFQPGLREVPVRFQAAHFVGTKQHGRQRHTYRLLLVVDLYVYSLFPRLRIWMHTIGRIAVCTSSKRQMGICDNERYGSLL
jgi:hypothetical protein